MKQLFEFVSSFLVIALVLAGIAGLSWELFRADGLFERIMGRIWEFELRQPLIAIPLTVGAIVLGRLWFQGRVTRGGKSILPTLLMALLMAAGAYYIGYYLITGMI